MSSLATFMGSTDSLEC